MRKHKAAQHEVVYHLLRHRVNLNDWTLVPSTALFSFLRGYEDSYNDMGALSELSDGVFVSPSSSYSSGGVTNNNDKDNERD
jgi:hypothetical protein